MDAGHIFYAARIKGNAGFVLPAHAAVPRWLASDWEARARREAIRRRCREPGGLDFRMRLDLRRPVRYRKDPAPELPGWRRFAAARPGRGQHHLLRPVPEGLERGGGLKDHGAARNRPGVTSSSC